MKLKNDGWQRQVWGEMQGVVLPGLCHSQDPANPWLQRPVQDQSAIGQGEKGEKG